MNEFKDAINPSPCKGDEKWELFKRVLAYGESLRQLREFGFRPDLPQPSVEEGEENECK